MDYLSSLPDAVLSIIHHLVHKSGGLRSVLHFEAASKKLRISFCKYSRLKLAICTKCPALLRYITRSTAAGPSFSFSRWLAAHGHRLDHLTLNELHLQPGGPALCGQPGLTQVSELTITTSAPHTLDPLKGLGNLVQLSCWDVGERAGQYGADNGLSLEPLGLLTALKSLELVDFHCILNRDYDMNFPPCTAIRSLAPLSSLTNLTELGLLGLEAPTISLAALASLGPTLSRLTCFVENVSMDPVSSFTNLTSLSWATVDKIVGLEPIGNLLKLRSLHMKNHGVLVNLDLQPLSALAMLQTLSLDGRIFPVSMQPIGALGRTLQELYLGGYCQADNIQGMQAALSHLSALVRLDVLCDSLDCLSPLTSLRQLKLCCHGSRTLGPIQTLTALTQLVIEDAFEITSLQPLCLLGCLQQLSLVFFWDLSSLQPLSTLTALKSLELDHCECVSSLAPLAALAGLQQLTIHYCHRINQSMCSSLRSALPGLTLVT